MERSLPDCRAERLRAFVAVEVPPEAKEALGQAQARWRRVAPPTVRWANLQGLHLTLKFLGNISRGQVEAVTAAMARVAEGIPPFTLELGETGAFPNPRHPRVVWVGVAGQLEPLRELYQRLEAELSALGFPREERPFSPHLTLGRVRDTRRAVSLLQGAVSPIHWQVDHVDLMQSTLLPSGAVYNRLCAVHLAGEL